MPEPRHRPTQSILVDPRLWHQHYHQKSGVMSKRVNVGLNIEKTGINAGQLSEVSIIRKQAKNKGYPQKSNATHATWFMKRDTADQFHQRGQTPEGYSVVQEQSILEDYVMEATFSELMRALDPHHPKARVVMQNDKIHLMSKAIPGFCPLEDVCKNKHAAIGNGDAFKAGVKDGTIKGFAKSMVMKLWIGDRDWHAGNAGLRTNEDGTYSVVSIDHGQSLGYLITRGNDKSNTPVAPVDYSIDAQDWKGLPYRKPEKVINNLDQVHHQMITPYLKGGQPTKDTQLLDEEMVTNTNFLNEKNAALLSIALLPEGVIKKHCFDCIANPAQAEQIYQGLLLRRAQMLDAAFSCDTSFARYLDSHEAKIVLQQTADNLKEFKLAGNRPLIPSNSHTTLQHDINQEFVNLKNYAWEQLHIVGKKVVLHPHPGPQRGIPTPPKHQPMIQPPAHSPHDFRPMINQLGQQLNIARTPVPHARAPQAHGFAPAPKQHPPFTPPPNGPIYRRR